MPVFVGCDLGTMGTKAAVVDAEGRLLGDAFEEVPLRSPRPGWVEQDLEEIEASAHRTIRPEAASAARMVRCADASISSRSCSTQPGRGERSGTSSKASPSSLP
ncbi:MAG TPA: FGGY family carbohydrate kinase, partial [Geodermatophilus sp.]|nr:FGGY family carbohydrate kinase [Geodermatophilus sp.]